MNIIYTVKRHNPNVFNAYITPDRLQALDGQLAELDKPPIGNLDEKDQRWFYKGLVDAWDGPSQRSLIVDPHNGMEFDGTQFGELPRPSKDDFDIDYSAVDFTLSVLGKEGQRLYDNPQADNYEMIERVLRAARLVMAVSFTPPSLA